MSPNDFWVLERATGEDDSGRRGKRLEVAFAKVLRLAGLDFEENGMRGASGSLWDFVPRGLKWNNLPKGTKVNLKGVSSRTLWSSAPVWRELFKGKYGKVAVARSKARKVFRKMGFHRVYWLMPRNSSVERQVFGVARSEDKAKAKALLLNKNWYVERLGSYDVAVDMKGKVLNYVSVLKAGKLWAQVSVRRNEGAGSTYAQVRRTKASHGGETVSIANEAIRRVWFGEDMQTVLSEIMGRKHEGSS